MGHRHAIAAVVGIGLIALAAAAGAIEMKRHAVAALGGRSTGAAIALGQTAGLATSGRSESAGGTIVAFAGFWFPEATPPVAVGDVGTVPRTTRLAGSFPNPFNPTTRVQFELAGDAAAAIATRLEVFDVRGRRVVTLVDAPLPAGVHTINWDGRDDGGLAVASGAYFLRLRAGTYTRTIRVVAAK